MEGFESMERKFKIEELAIESKCHKIIQHENRPFDHSLLIQLYSPHIAINSLQIWALTYTLGLICNGQLIY